jgi:O-methyltransferase
MAMIVTSHDYPIEKRYLELLKGCLTRDLFVECMDLLPYNDKTTFRYLRSCIYMAINKLLRPFSLILGAINRPTGETMIGLERLNNIQYCIENILSNDVPGDLIETGVWRGGATIFMKAVLTVYGDKERNVWVADSFEGLPKPNPEHYPSDRQDKLWSQSLAVSQSEVEDNFRRYDLLDERVFFLKGFFSETLPSAPIEKLSLLRLDGDMYESTILALENLYPKLSDGGYVIVDDYGCIPACKKATNDYRCKMGIQDPIQQIDWTGVYWRKTGQFSRK